MSYCTYSYRCFFPMRLPNASIFHPGACVQCSAVGERKSYMFDSSQADGYWFIRALPLPLEIHSRHHRLYIEVDAGYIAAHS